MLCLSRSHSTEESLLIEDEEPRPESRGSRHSIGFPKIPGTGDDSEADAVFEEEDTCDEEDQNTPAGPGAVAIDEKTILVHKWLGGVAVDSKSTFLLAWKDQFKLIFSLGINNLHHLFLTILPLRNHYDANL